MFRRMTQVAVLAACLTAASAASAADRNVVVPVIAGVAVGALLGVAFSQDRDDRHRYHRPAYKAPKRVVHYAPAPRHYRPVQYVAVPVQAYPQRPGRGHHYYRR
ncbi:MAG: hypothetical protein KJ884_00630 [Gammaproteobacteria bacterium]|jgi:hypothetical protein|nr:hypothetical protein [Gammaproteobacteria bacterium]MBU1488482.1 hypothetical protein [Gammaproteobacteria bacterium]MBU2067073.1 hypothetical protein [Gammaproteobacteria bacterium]MBU2138094.1 hypothetical protein [Gammaproteobacteria bacterium]MBU2216071.1 hypothetical protein [Gammaproteobacteria bacterium]